MDSRSVSEADEQEHDPSREKLLGDDSSRRIFDGAAGNTVNKKRLNRFVRAAASHVFHLAFIVLYSVALVAIARRGQSCPACASDKDLIYSPVRDLVAWEKKTLDASVLHGNVFKGPPRPELDEAWGRLLRNANIRVSADMLEQADKDSIPLADGSGYYAILDVYHQLHCLRYIRHYVYEDYYGDTLPWTPTHIDHCIDSIRQNLMCNADISLMTFRWVDDDILPKPNFRGEHQCRNWEKIEDWMAEHSFDPDDPAMLKHP